MTTVGYRHHLKPALICALLCLVAQEALGSKDYFSNEMTNSWRDLSKQIRPDLPGGALFIKITQEIQKSNPQEPLGLLIAGETLKVYNTIFSKLLEKTKDQATKKNLNYLKSRTEELRNVYFSDSQKQLEILTHVLEELKAINANDDVVQSKAIKEMKSIYNWASSLGEANKRQLSQSNSTLRRRRQTRRRSVRPRA